MNMKALRLTWMSVTLLCILVSCNQQSGKKDIQGLNREKFSSTEKRDDAKFLVNAIDRSHALLQLGSAGEARLSDSSDRRLALEFVQRHTKVALRLKTYAESRGITIPLSGQLDSTRILDRLASMESNEFSNAWINEVDKLNKQLKKDLENYHEDASDSLKVLLDTTTFLMSQNEELLRQFK